MVLPNLSYSVKHLSNHLKEAMGLQDWRNSKGYKHGNRKISLQMTCSLWSHRGRINWNPSFVVMLTNSTCNPTRGFHGVIFVKNWSSWFHDIWLRHFKINGYCMTQPCPVILLSVKSGMDFIVDTFIPRSDMLANRNSFG